MSAYPVPALPAFDKMIDEGRYKLDLTADYDQGITSHLWATTCPFHGLVHHRSEVFAVVHWPARRGMGGMDESEGPSLTIFRLTKERR